MRIPADWRRRQYWGDTAQALLFLLPVLAVLGVFVYYAFGNAFYLALQKVWPVRRVGSEIIPFYTEYIGLGNFQFIFFRDRFFLQALYQTVLYVAISVPVTLAVALLLAALLNQGVRLRPFFRLAYFMPYITPVVAISLVWQWIFNWRSGLLNYVLGLFGVSMQNWLNDPNLALPAVIIMNVWRYAGWQSIILLAGMQNIDRSYYEAARVDGATAFQVWRRITFPLLTPQIFFVLIISMIGSFKIFEEIFILFAGSPGPRRSALTLVYYIFDMGFQRYRYGVAAAASVVLFGIILLFTLFQLVVTQRRVHYQQ
ncbi:MAG: carbohydrate ABC transporter permease [Candidatus Bipolaricaulaceae bacterium]